MTYDEIVDYLYHLPRFTKGGHMENVRKLLAALSNPQDSLKYIHVAGTNGKGSVCAYLDSCLRACGQRTGLFTSPHLVRVNERMRICGQEISDEDFVRIFYEIYDLAKQEACNGCEEPTFFEYIYLMAMVYFRECSVDYAIIETGLGGRMDFTNAVSHPVLTVLTPISMDHMEVLGDTIEKIADEKAGIIKAGSPLIFYGQDPRVRNVIMEYVHRFGVDAVEMDDSQVQIMRDDGKTIDFSLNCGYHGSYRFTLNTAAAYQAVNAGLAVLGFQKIWPLLPHHMGSFADAATEALKAMRWPGRMEALADGFYVDGAHNEAGIDAFVKTIARGFGEQPLYIAFAVAGDKNYPEMIRRLCEIPTLAGVVVTEIENGRRCDLKKVEQLFRKNWNGLICSTYNIKEALRLGMDMRGAATKAKDNKGILCCVGSLYLVGSVKELWSKGC